MRSRRIFSFHKMLRQAQHDSVGQTAFVILRERQRFEGSFPQHSSFHIEPLSSFKMLRQAQHDIYFPRSLDTLGMTRQLHFNALSCHPKLIRWVCYHFSDKSSHFGLTLSINSFFFSLRHPFNCFSRLIAQFTSIASSK